MVQTGVETPGPYQLLLFFEGVLEGKTGVRPNLHSGPEKGRQLGSAKNLLDNCEQDYRLAQDVIRLWAEDRKSVEQYPRLSNVVYHSAQLVYRVRVKGTRSSTFKKGKGRL